MKVSIGTKIKHGPWGGGNLFAINLKNYLESKGHTVVHDLVQNDIDIILITEPRRTSESSAFTHIDVQNYIKYKNSNALITHRINECDERKNTNYVNKFLIEANKTADTTVFVSSWLKDLYIDQGMDRNEKYVIYSGSDSSVFNNQNLLPWNKKEKIRIVTHHWGANWNKGFEVYKRIDDMIGESYWKNKIAFNYIGNLPKKFNFLNSLHTNPLSGYDLANSLKENHLYITGSLYEPSGNHHIEASQCGLPLMYIDSGGTTEYCSNYGLKYNINNLEQKLKYMIKNYDKYLIKMKSYPQNALKMCSDFEQLFIYMLENKTSLISARKLHFQGNLIEKNYYKLKDKLRIKLN